MGFESGAISARRVTKQIITIFSIQYSGCKLESIQYSRGGGGVTPPLRGRRS